MKNHTKVYIKALGYNDTDYMPSELSGSKGVDIHHIIDRVDRIENLILLTRDEHLEYGEIKSKMVFLLESHMRFLEDNGVIFSYEWFNEQITKYSIYDNRN
jgi:hypothetical protein